MSLRGGMTVPVFSSLEDIRRSFSTVDWRTHSREEIAAHDLDLASLINKEIAWDKAHIPGIEGVRVQGIMFVHGFSDPFEDKPGEPRVFELVDCSNALVVKPVTTYPEHLQEEFKDYCASLKLI